MKINMKIGTRILAGYGLALLVVGGVGVVAYRSLGESIDSSDWVIHTHKVKETINQVLSALKDAETGQRGFLLTGEERYLEPYTSGAREIDRRIQDLRDLTSDNRNQQKRVSELEPLAAAKLAELAEAIGLRRQRGERAAVEVVLTDRGKQAMDQIRALLKDMDDEETELLKQRDQVGKASSRFAMSALLAGGALVVILVSIIGLLTQRSITRPLADFMQFVGRVGQGDLTQKSAISSSVVSDIIAQ